MPEPLIMPADEFELVKMINDAMEQGRLVTTKNILAILEGKSPVAVHNLLCGCVSADCDIRFKTRFLLQPAGMVDYLHRLMSVWVPDDVLDRVFAELSPAECDRMRKFLMKAEGA